MICEIGAFLPKGTGHELFAHFEGEARVLAFYLETGRSDDLFYFHEFGSASEVDIVTLLVRPRDGVAMFDALYDRAGLGEARTGLVYLQMHARFGG